MTTINRNVIIRVVSLCVGTLCGDFVWGLATLLLLLLLPLLLLLLLMMMTMPVMITLTVDHLNDCVITTVDATVVMT